jgi:hypothetical protein
VCHCVAFRLRESQSRPVLPVYTPPPTLSSRNAKNFFYFGLDFVRAMRYNGITPR